MIATDINPYRGLSDAELDRELQALATRVAVFKTSTTPAGTRLFLEFRKRLDDARAEQERRSI
jgi:hypothetical protein